MYSYTKKFNRINNLQLNLDNIDENEASFFWENNKSDELIIGLGMCDEIELFNSMDLELIQSKITERLNNIKDLTPELGMKPKFFGGYEFNIKNTTGKKWDNFPKGYFILPKYIIMSNQYSTFITLISQINKSHITSIDTIYKKIIDNTTQIKKRKKHINMNIINEPDSKSNYLKIINNILSDIKKGIVDKVVLSKLKTITIDRKFSISNAIRHLRIDYPECINFYIHLPNRGIFLGSTPERLIKKNDDEIISEAIAGTIKRGLNSDEDLKLENKLRTDLKNLEEHNLVIKEITNLLSPILNNIIISESPQILKLKNVQHLITNIIGKLKNNIHIIDLVNMIHPTPAVSGYPVETAKHLINQYETHHRGWYSGPIGWIDSLGNGDFCVGLRSSYIKNKTIQLFSGGGIVLNSIPEEEWIETELKMKPILEIIENNGNK